MMDGKIAHDGLCRRGRRGGRCYISCCLYSRASSVLGAISIANSCCVDTMLMMIVVSFLHEGCM
eukprot:scaffold1186_cov75-Skeletonema_marinoi.AAC.2